MSNRPGAVYPIAESSVSGTDLARLLEQTEGARNSNDSGSTRPSYLTAGGLWSKAVTGGYDVMLYDGTNDIPVAGKTAAAPSDGKTYAMNNGAWVLTWSQTEADNKYALKSHTHTWAQVTGKPATYPPTIGTSAATAAAGNHNHNTVYYTKAEVDAAIATGGTTSIAWSAVTGKPATFPPVIGTTSAVAAAGNHTHSGYLPASGSASKTSGDLTFNTNVAVKFGGTRFYTSGSTSMRLDLSGMTFYIRSGSTTRYTFDLSGNFTASGNVTANSDRRLKDDLNRITGALDKACELTGYTYRRIDMDNARQAGVIAQEVQAVLPEAVREGEDGMLSVNALALVGLLVEAVNELKEKVDALTG